MQVVPAAWLRLFSTQEVGQLLSGGEAGAISVQDLRQHTAYSGGFSARSSTVASFWKVGRGCPELAAPAAPWGCRAAGPGACAALTDWDLPCAAL